MPASIDLGGIHRIRQRFLHLADIAHPATIDPLLRSLGGLIVEDNRAGVLAGLDKDGNPAPPLSYRGGKGTPTAYRTDWTFGTTRGRHKGRDIARGRFILPNNNLPTWVYQTMTGPRLAPRRESSRVISNFKLREPYREGGSWIIEAYWDSVLDAKGEPFLQYHFDGLGQKKYDLRGIRPGTREKARRMVADWLVAVVRDVRKLA